MSGSSIRYLLAIYQLSDGGAAVRSVDIANLLQVTRASVVKSLKKLTEEGAIHKDYYGNIQLTPMGMQLGNRISTEYELLFSCFAHHFGLSEDQARQDALSALCYFSPQAREALIQCIQKKAHPPL